MSTSQPSDVIAQEKLTVINASDWDFDDLNSNQISDDDFHVAPFVNITDLSLFQEYRRLKVTGN